MKGNRVTEINPSNKMKRTGCEQQTGRHTAVKLVFQISCRRCADSCCVKNRSSLGSRPVHTAEQERCLLCKHVRSVRICQDE